MNHRNNKESLSEVLTGLGYASKTSTYRQNYKDLFYYLFYLYIFNPLKANRGAR